MIKVIKKSHNSSVCGFTVSGHSGYAEEGCDIICASVSSAVYMAVNTITEILGVPVEADIKDGYMDITLSGKDSAAQDILSGLFLHLTQLSEEYPQFIKITTEV